MEILMMLLVLCFLGLIGAASLFFLKGPEDAPGQEKTKNKIRDIDIAAQLKKKIASDDEKIKNLELNLGAVTLELTQTKEKEKMLLKERSQVTFDSEQYEKFKKEHHALKTELTRKEETLENEISERRRESASLMQLKIDHADLKKKLSQTEDALRKAEAAVETLKKEFSLAKRPSSTRKKSCRNTMKTKPKENGSQGWNSIRSNKN